LIFLEIGMPKDVPEGVCSRFRLAIRYVSWDVVD
jgi:hypothetical protein